MPDKHTSHLRIMREHSRQTQATTAKSLGIKRATYAHIERGFRIATLPVAFAIARHFDTMAETLFDESGRARFSQMAPEAN